MNTFSKKMVPKITSWVEALILVEGTFCSVVEFTY